jgi:hypothetical protein
MRIEVNGVVVRDIRPAPYLGLTVHWSRRFPEKTIHARLTAPDTGCWKATIESEVEKGCGSKDLVLDVQGDINVAIERDPPAAWTWCLNLEADGKVFQTYGPDSNPQYALGFGYEVLRLSRQYTGCACPACDLLAVRVLHRVWAPCVELQRPAATV